MIWHFLHKLQAILSTFSGWVSLFGVVLANFFARYQSAIEAVVIVVTLDLALTIASAIKRGTFAYSYLGKESVSKLSVYGSVIVGFVVLDKLVSMALPVTTIVVCLLISLVELWSMAGSMLIVFPNMPFLRLLRPIQKGEMRIS